MAREKPSVDGYPFVVIPLHSNMPGHHLPLRKFIGLKSSLGAYERHNGTQGVLLDG